MDTDPATTPSPAVEFGEIVSSVTTLLDCEGVLFDFNGTLSDDEWILERIFIELAAKECGVFLAEQQYRAELYGRSDSEIARAIMAKGGAADIRECDFLELLDHRYNEEVSLHSPISEDTCALVHSLQAAGIQLGVVTGAGRATVLPALERAGVRGAFSVVVTQEDVKAGKPDPEGLLMAAAALGLEDPRRVAVFEDSVPGLQAVGAAGMVPLAVGGILPKDSVLPFAAVWIEQLGRACLQTPLRPAFN
ncbi:HAD family phosphatase [Pseudarthrobacter sp. AL07]|uniref:HAD family hydrolase n=1 Tax=unclassified Pseudarthrobacter TaxID=2647000 RepID=UPI00249AE7D5|nr:MULTISPECIES: HAD family phosphatase [unclassified Pseudarthrobacter]MDI3195479.1 HAD family phosphatase [Pseudarthrobacter sp. AL20]MDI3209546.1 HAD family phosphatase [Pseudarthrobacter sp. AL07]